MTIPDRVAKLEKRAQCMELEVQRLKQTKAGWEFTDLLPWLLFALAFAIVFQGCCTQPPRQHDREVWVIPAELVHPEAEVLGVLPGDPNLAVVEVP